jgi:hypothetical protein
VVWARGEGENGWIEDKWRYGRMKGIDERTDGRPDGRGTEGRNGVRTDGWTMTCRDECMEG